MAERETSPETRRWAVLRELLERALDVPAAERDAFLARECDGDDALLSEAREFLAEDERDDGGLEPPTGLFDRAVAPAEQRIGPYLLRRRIGSGGMGTVYLAVRADGAFRQRVAVKRLHGGDGPDIAARFRRERQVLANLEHPSIARLIDGGVDAGGEPYLVMEYVEGRRIDDACDEDRLDVRERIELFRRVCAAVSFAHRNLVVHRDIKPGNILVTPDGEPKLLDFGVAKVLDPEKVADDPELTLAGRHAFTPAYASPEQMRGRPVTTTSDVYSLGVLLCQLLTGRMPYDLETTSIGERERIVCEVDPQMPSALVLEDRPAGRAEEIAARRRTTPRQLARSLRGDLDNIVAMALRKEPGRRYDSVERLSDDLSRHLEGLPVRARPDTFVYRSSRFLRRHRASVAAGVLAFGGLLGGLLFARHQYLDAERARAAERAERQVAQARAAELEELARDLDEQRALAAARADTLEEQRAELERQREAARAHLADVHSFATRLVFDVFRQIHPLAGSERARETVLEMGLEYLDKVAEAGEPDPSLLRELSTGYLRLGELQGDPSASNFGDSDLALEMYEKGLAFAERAAEAEPDDPRNVYSVAQATLKLGDLQRGLGNWRTATEHHRRALELARPLERAEPIRPGFLYVLFLLYDRNRMAATETGDFERAREYIEAAARCLGKASEMLPQLATSQAGIHQAWAELHAAEGDVDAALEQRRLELESLERTVREHPEHAIYAESRDLGRVSYARTLFAAGRPQEAGEMLVPVLEGHLAEREGDPAPEDRRKLDDRIDAFVLGARIAVAEDDPARGLELARLAARDAEIVAGEPPVAIEHGLARAEALRVLARAELALGRLTAARDRLVDAVGWLEAAGEGAEAPPGLASSLALARGDLARVAWRQATALPAESEWRRELEDEARRLADAALGTLADRADAPSRRARDELDELRAKLGAG